MTYEELDKSASWFEQYVTRLEAGLGSDVLSID